MVDKRRRNSRSSKYRPRTEAQKQRRRQLWDARANDRAIVARLSEEDALKVRLDELEGALRDVGAVGIHNRRHTVPLDEIEDDEQRFHVLKARVERLEALWSINRRKRETRGKIIIGGALLAEAADGIAQGDCELLQRLVDIIDRRVERVRDRLTVRELLGDVPLPLRPGGEVDEGVEAALAAAGEGLQRFDAMAESADGDEGPDGPIPDEMDAEHENLEASWRATG